MKTISVLWPDKFGSETVNINESDFDPAIHKLPGQEEVKESPVEGTKPRKRKAFSLNDSELMRE